ncbi:hypothetical protein Natpe_4315 (plasmid) [Natrinema pellirubrum DSM 15624]|uniref:Uncharacterized protein n=1 Tax=Natrinema pellirubrum (strain DSM 15624 / CIP 106293 / JCM 10476 / NCIMB 786 / 157) TaxID=797303 RepID=L0JUE3_NATP1|nr:hypothetical protein Natpe_4315 [Natrinema pellirubrum DSM 15624]
MDSTYKAEAQLLYDVVDWFAEKLLCCSVE